MSANREVKRRTDRLVYERRPDLRKAKEKRYAEKYPEKRHAKDALRHAVDRGQVQKPSQCAWCGSSASLQAHHEDYSKPLDVVWLCVPCHGKTRVRLAAS